MVKYKIIFFMILFSISSIGVFATMKGNNLDLIGKTIYVDPGHGGRDNGTSYQNILEKNINLQIAQKLELELLKNGAIVLMTRSKDIDLSKKHDISKKKGDLNRRIKLIADSNAHLYVSIHTNWYKESQYGGIDILYNEINKNNLVFANYLYKEFKDDELNVRDVKKTYDYMYKNIKNVGLLIECGFLSNNKDRYLLQNDEYQQRLIKNIVKSIIKYFNS